MTNRNSVPAQAGSFTKEVKAYIPYVRAFLRAMYVGDQERADIAAQRAITTASKYEIPEGKTVEHWVINIALSDRQTRREVLSIPQEDESDRSLRAMLSRVPFEQRATLILREGKRLSYDEIALSLGCAVGTVKSRLNRVRAAMIAEENLHGELLPLAELPVS